ncbi:high affinity copper uptake protein 1-like isoform X2 [Ruditapes philippinarum]|uniref:high affinity copper uptake protein 1-like isoform X2 n=1 Tax=Ruditapes philippinarum TaxID=129788 RepID=UPI00295BBA8E|nr:high affinity copper uptake protein 1-like isoform X2 [Ruditapes philippinarum]
MIYPRQLKRVYLALIAVVIVFAFLLINFMAFQNTSTTTMNHMDMDHGDMGSGNPSGHLHSGLEMDMNETDRTCAGHMLMFFHTGKCEFILFETLRTKDVGGLVGACVAIFALAIVYEGLKVFREMLLQKAMISGNKYSISNGTASTDTMVISNKNVGSTQQNGVSGPRQQKPSTDVSCCLHMMTCSHFIQTVLHMIQVFISYCLMLVFMTYNVWLCLSVILGAGIGYFLFGWRKAIVVDINEHCH